MMDTCAQLFHNTEKTNVYKFYNNISLENTTDGWEYISGYYPGLGTNGNFPLLGGIFGYGISDQIINAYEFICKNYKASHDEIWLIGFSRGGMCINIIYAGNNSNNISSYTSNSLCCTKLVRDDLQCRTITKRQPVQIKASIRTVSR